jgi:hypothetical protein
MVPNDRSMRATPFSRPVLAGDYRVLVATLQAVQLATPAARASTKGITTSVQGGSDTPLLDILEAVPGWEEAVTRLGGSFSMHGGGTAGAGV